MCDFKIIQKTTNGLLLFCPNGDCYQLSFNNLLFNLNSYELNGFINFIKKIDLNYWEQEYKNSVYERKIPIPTIQSNLIIMMNSNEILELKLLFDSFKVNHILSYDEIKLDINYN